MPINYDAILTIQEKQEMLEMRIKQFAMQAYTLELEKVVQQNLNNEEAQGDIQQQIDALSEAITVHEEELNSLGVSNDTPES